VIPSYNSSAWLPSTLEALSQALAATRWDAEIVVVDDGSTDDTIAVLQKLKRRIPFPLRVIRQENSGPFAARWEGVRQAAHDDILALDSRVLVHEHALEYLERHRDAGVAGQPWNGHVVTDPTTSLVGQFWLVPTHVFWGKYLGNPRPIDITPENFDQVPKGTGFLLIRRELFLDACRFAWPEENADLTSDDTKLLRYVAQKVPIRLDPGFAATYRPRTSVRKFLGHGWHRGTLFVDSYAGTSRVRNVILILLATSPLVAVALGLLCIVLGQWLILLVGTAVLAAALVVPLVIAASRKCPRRALLSYAAFVIPFGGVFSLGLLRGLVVHRRKFVGGATRRVAKEVQT
jgi:glycosyltransferase involved in cell wall biosynthesis